MSNLPNPKIEFISGEQIKLLEDFEFDRAVVPAGFISDGTSIPRFLHSYVRPFGDGLRAALPHDANYRWQNVTRKEADRLFYRRLKMIGMRTSKAWALWAGVRSGGWVTWRIHKAVLDEQRERTKTDEVLNENH